MTKFQKISLSLLIFFFCTGFDRITKDFAQNTLSVSPPVSMLSDTIRIDYTENTGAMLGIGANLPAQVRTVLFIVLNGIVMALTAVYALKAHDLDLPQEASLFLLISGGIGNIIDRLVNNGAGIDFMNIGIGTLRTGIFNFADLFIMTGAVIFIIASLKKERDSIETHLL